MKGGSTFISDEAIAKELRFSWYLLVNACVMFAVGLFAVSFNKSCYSDGCLGVSVIGGWALTLLLLQVSVLIPRSAWHRKKSGQKWILPSIIWLIVSASIFFVTTHFAGPQYA